MFYPSSNGEWEERCKLSERIYIPLAIGKGVGRSKGGPVRDRLRVHKKQCPLLWIGCGQQSGKPTCKQEAEAPGVRWCLAGIIYENSYLEINPKFLQTEGM